MRGKKNRPAFVVLLVVLLVSVLELLSAAGIYYSNAFLGQDIRRTSDIFREQTRMLREYIESSARAHTVFDSRLGWRNRPNFQSATDRVNSQGLRSGREYSPVPRPGVVRIAAFGDSFVYGNEVTYLESWPALIEKTHRNMEVLNYGVGRYGPDQAYLRYKMEGANLSPRVVIIGFFPAYLLRVMNVYLPFFSTKEYPLVKPRYFLADNGDLVFIPSPIPDVSMYQRYLEHPKEIVELGKNDRWYEPAIFENPLYDYSATVRLFTAAWIRIRNERFDTDKVVYHGNFRKSSTAFRIQAALLDKFAGEVRSDGRIPVIVIFPDRDTIAAAFGKKRRLYDPIVDHIRAGRTEYIDLTEAFLATGAPEKISLWFAPGGHYSPAGNALVAAWLAADIETRVGVRNDD